MSGAVPMLALEGVSKRFGRLTALRDLHLAFDAPGVYGLLGPNGAGKTTTFKIIAGLLRPSAGRVRIEGIDVHRDTRDAMAHLGVQFDSPAFYPYLSGCDNLKVIAHWIGRRLDDRIGELLERVGLSRAADQAVREYSWGMKQRLGLAATLLPDPRLLLLDEPTNGLDPAGIADIRRLLPQWAGERGRIVILSSHRMGEVERMSDHVTIIHQGAIVASGRPGELAGGQAVIEIECDVADRAAELLRQQVPLVELERLGSHRLHVRGYDRPASHLNRFLIEGGVAVEQIREQRESLEEVFFRLTGGGDDA